jgi:hypothetical protein
VSGAYATLARMRTGQTAEIAFRPLSDPWTRLALREAPGAHQATPRQAPSPRTDSVTLPTFLQECTRSLSKLTPFPSPGWTAPKLARCCAEPASSAACGSGLSTNPPQRHFARAPFSAQQEGCRLETERISTLLHPLFRLVRRRICRQRRRHDCRQISGRVAGFLRTCLHSLSFP